METSDISIFSNKEKLVIYKLLVEVMNADNVQRIEEKRMLNNIQSSFSLSVEETNKAQKISLGECKKQISKFSDKKRTKIKSLLEEMAKVDGAFVEQEKDLIDSLKLGISHYELELIADWRDDRQAVIGYYTKKDDGKYYIEDIRSLGFSELTYKNGEDISIEIEKDSSLEENTYYEFSWTTKLDESKRGFHLIPRDRKFKMVKPKELVNRLYAIWENSDLDVIKQLSDVQRMVNTQLTASSDGTFIYELLQNANDYPVKEGSEVQLVDVEFHLTDYYLIYRHTGRYFSPRNIAAISKMSAGEKKKEKNAIGYKGIGFKTVFSENQYVYLESGDYTLRFDEKITEESSRFPWQIMPIWTPENEVAKEVQKVMSDDKKFRVQMAIRPNDTSKLREGDKSFEYIFKDIFKDEKDILFIPNLKSVKIFYDGKEQINRIKDPDKWVLTVKPLVYKFTQEEIEENNCEVIANKRIPEKYKDFEDTRISFACLREGNKLLPVKKARVYCYLPTQVSLGFPFLMNTDMIPTGPRDDFEKKIHFNHKLMKIAGGKLTEWISSLLKSKEFDLCSVFSIIPSFESVENYEDFIEEFKEGFDETLENMEFIPNENGGYSVIFDTIIDETGITSSDIMTDNEFLKLVNWEGNLPAKELRKNRKFKSFVKEYIDDENIFDSDALKEAIRKDEFREWLVDQDNNNKFLKFLLQKELLQDFFDEEIFLDEINGGLYSADSLFYDIDEELKDIFTFSHHLEYLSLETRKFFKKSKKWEEIVEENFAEFDARNFVNITLLKDNWDDTIELLQTWGTSYHFYSFLAKNDIVPDDILELPFFNDEDEPVIVDSFEDKFVFFSSVLGKETCRASWLSTVTFAFISSKYDKQTLSYFENNAEVREFSDSVIIKEIILSDDYQSNINDDQQKSEDDSADFVRYCYHQKDEFETGALKDYALSVIDKDGNKSFTLSEEHIYFPSEVFDDYAAKEWINYAWMYCLDSIYLSKKASQEKLQKEFLHKAFCLYELDDKSFYTDVVKKNIKEIIINTSGDNDSDGNQNVDFVCYLEDNYKLIFEEKKDADIFDKFVILGEKDGNAYDISSKVEHIYTFDNELKDIIDSGWFPGDVVDMCSSRYDGTKSLISIKVQKYTFPTFFDDVITEEMLSINDNIETKDKGVSFHQFIIERKKELTDKQKEVMKDATIYLYGDTTASPSSSGHKILSAKAKELFDKGLVDFSDLDIIDPDYKTEENADYWETLLGNSKFIVTDFISWLSENTESFCETIEDKNLNISFWRWLKENKISDKVLESLPILPIFLKDDEFVDSDSSIYLSDDYIEEGGLETIVTKFNPEASFVSADYIDEGDEIDDWKGFWAKIGVRFEMIDILIDTIDNRLSETDDAKLPATLAKYRSKLEEIYEDLPAVLSELRVKAQDGQFYSIADIIYVNCGEAEPFGYVDMPNQVSFVTVDERRLITDILLNIDGNKIDNLVEWTTAKIDRYIGIQDDEEQEEYLRSVHFRFIDELAEMYSNERERVNKYEKIKEVKLLNEDGIFCTAANLTMGSIYNPLCDFEKFNLSYHYLSEEYDNECNNDVRRLFQWVLKVHCSFDKNDIHNLSNKDFSIYFWSEYLRKKEITSGKIRDYMEEGLFDNVSCIPTKDCMKKPCDLYSTMITSYVKNTEDYENKQPLESLPDIEYNKSGDTLFSLLNFKKQLDFLDSLYALFNINGQEKRIKLLQWMIDSYDEKYDSFIDEYREDEGALWKNSKNNEVQIKQLYALAYGDKMLEQYFGTLPQILNKDYFPKGDSFRKACDILKITTIEPSDLIVEPIEKKNQSDKIKKELMLSVLVLAGYVDKEEWNRRYEEYKTKIGAINFWCSQAISLRYSKDESICQKLKKFHHEEDSTDFYFVKSLQDNKVFLLYVESIIDYLGIEAEEEFAAEVMDGQEAALNIAKENNTLMLDEAFKDELDKLIPGIKRELNGNEAEDEDIQEDNIRHTFTTYTDEENDSSNESENDEEGDNANGNAESTKEEEITSEEEYTFEDEELEGINNESYSFVKHLSGTDTSGINYASATTELPYSNESYNENDYEKMENNKGESLDYETCLNKGVSCQRTPRDTSKYKPVEKGEGKPYSDMSGWNRTSRNNTPKRPKPYSPEDVEKFKSHGISRTLEVLEPTTAEVDELNRILGEDLTAEQIADQNHLAQLRLYNNLINKGMNPNESKEDFVRNAHLKNEHTLHDDKYIHKCSAAGGIMYLSPSIWNKIADDNCIVCVYLGAKANEFMYFNSIDDILKWIGEDDIVIKLTGEEKADVVEELYSGVLNGVKGTAYTLIRINSNEKYDSVFAQVVQSKIDNETENGNDY